MPSSIHYTSLYGTTPNGPMCSLLEIDDINILLDCGWDELFNVTVLKPLESLAKKIDIILISFPDLQHSGAIPYIYKHYGCKARIFITRAASNISYYYFEEAIRNRCMKEEFQLFDINSIKTIKSHYYNELTLHERFFVQVHDMHFVISPYEAGHILGGAMWKIETETDTIYYAIHINHKQEIHINKSDYIDIVRPSLLITDSCQTKMATVKKTFEMNLDKCLNDTVSDGGNVLIPIDCMGRIYELLIILNKIWIPMKDSNIKIYFLTNDGTDGISSMRRLIQYMPKEVMTKASQEGKDIFDFENIKVDSTYDNILLDPDCKIVLATSSGLESSYGQDLLKQWCMDPKNLLLFLFPPPLHSLAHDIYSNPKQTQFHYTNRVRIPLEGSELTEYFQEQAKKKKMELLQKREKEKEAENSSSNEDEDEDEDEDEYASKMNTNSLVTQRYPMFERKKERVTVDAYGQMIDIEKYKIKKIEEAQHITEEQHNEDFDIPYRYSTSRSQISITMKRLYLDFQGICDVNSFITILDKIQPKKILFCQGSFQVSQFYSQYLQKTPYIPAVYIPQNSERLSIPSNTITYNITLDEQLIDSIPLYSIGDYKVGYVDGTLCRNEEVDGEKQSSRSYTLKPTKTFTPHKTSLLRDSQLTLRELKPLLNKVGISSILKNKCISIDNQTIRIKKEEDSIIINSICSPSFYKLRKTLYEQFKET
ncbi:hypothetical protein WA158_004788 [Blastocystis sp. Blastoise]